MYKTLVDYTISYGAKYLLIGPSLMRQLWLQATPKSFLRLPQLPLIADD